MWLKTKPDGTPSVDGMTKPYCYHIDQFSELQPVIHKVMEYSKAMGLDMIQGDHEDAPGQLELNFNFDVAEKTWHWDVNAVWSRNHAEQTFTGNVNAQRVQQALGPVAGCTGSCVPLNIFGGAGTITGSGLTVHYLDPLPPVEGVEGAAHFTREEFTADFTRGHIHGVQVDDELEPRDRFGSVAARGDVEQHNLVSPG